MRAPARIAELVARLLEQSSALNAGATRHTYGGRRTFEVFKAFDQIGPPLTDHAEPTAFRQGRLTLTVRSSTWLTELAMMQNQMIERINQRLPSPMVRELRLVLGQPLRKASSLPDRDPKLSPAQREKVNAWASSLSHDRVREAFERAAARSLEAGPVGQPPFHGPAGPRVLAPTVVEDDEPELSYGYGNRSFDRWKMRKKTSR